jgi:CHASE2 domain-containing sensor protein
MELKHKRLLVIAAVFCATLAVQFSGLLRTIDASLSERRMAFSPREAGGEVVSLGIDKRSLEAVGTWPWPRDIHAQIIRRLGELGASEIYLDIEFGAPSNAASDEILARAIGDSPVAVVLPVLLQEAVLSAERRKIEASMPLPMFRDEAWLATVNVIPDADGVVRRFPYGLTVDGDELPSIPAMLSGVLGPSDSEFAIDFSISPDSVAVHSAAELLDGELAADALQGKRVVVGAHAIELRDNLAVPDHGTVSGAMLQILAAETLT